MSSTSLLYRLSFSFPEMYSSEKHRMCSRFCLILISFFQRRKGRDWPNLPTRKRGNGVKRRAQGREQQKLSQQKRRLVGGPGLVSKPLSSNSLPSSFTVVAHSCGPKLGFNCNSRGKGCPAKLIK